MTTKKKRIHELAKELGLSAQILVAKLQARGFDVKGPQSALDEFTLLQAQGMLEAEGIVAKPDAPEASSVETSGGLTIRKKKKRTSVDGAATDAEVAAEAPPVPAPAAEEPPAPPSPAPAEVTPPSAQPLEPLPESVGPVAETRAVEEPPASAAPSRSPAPASVGETAAPAYAAPAAAHAAPVVEALPEMEPAPASDRDVLTPVAHASIEAPTQPAADAPTAAAPSPSATAPTHAAAQAPAGPAAKPLPDDLVKPALQRRPGKVVGFVDLTKVQAQARPQAQARKLRSKDDVAPNVQPTFGNDRKKALVRGDHAQRGTLTAAQLREKESARFLRRRGATTSGPGAVRPGASPQKQGIASGVSPLAGSEVTVEAPITVKKLADALSVKSNQVLAYAMLELGLSVNINSVLEDAAAELLAEKFDVQLKVSQTLEAEQALLEKMDQARGQIDESDFVTRPPSIAFLGHVDHGKTTLLDTIRSSRVAKGEAGGITQHIGAYQVTTKKGAKITILDTPGHEAFSAMRARGAQAVDIVVLVVAADDGVMPSTLEAIAHAKAAKTPVVVALNKCDKAEANPERVRQQLAGHELLSEKYGGDVGMIEVSATKGTGIDELLDRVVLESEVLELKSHAAGPASGVVLEAEVQEGKGRVAFLLIKEGTLNQGDVILAGEGYGRVRSIHDDRGQSIKNAGPSMPVEVSGLSELPGVGDQFHVVDNLEDARLVAEERARKNRTMSLAERRAVTAENLSQALSAQAKKTINVVLKADVQGSLEALKKQIESLTHAEVDVRLLHAALGTVTESDVNLAAGSSALVLAFHVGVNEKARTAAERSGVEIRPYEVIYEMLDDLRGLMEGTLAPEISEQVLGHVEVRALFKSSKFGNVAGSHVVDGTVTRDSRVRVLRGKTVLFTGTIAGLRREKDEVKEVREGFDCGVTLKDFDAFEVGDVIEAFKMVTTKRLLKI